MSTTLSALTRDRVGTRASRKLRAEGRIPATLQGGGAAPHVDLSIDEEEFLTTRRHHEHLYELQLDGKVETALIEGLQWDVFGEHIAHVEFRRVDRHARTDVTVPLEFQGHPKDGILTHLLTELSIITTPDAIPNSLVIKVGELTIGASILAGEVPLPPGATLDPEQDPQQVVAQVVEVKIEVVAPPEPAPDAAATMAAAAPKVPAPEEPK
jgi:large subunit ribosomal protein L25